MSYLTTYPMARGPVDDIREMKRIVILMPRMAGKRTLVQQPARFKAYVAGKRVL